MSVLDESLKNLCIGTEICEIFLFMCIGRPTCISVSYTHLDVYKRQFQDSTIYNNFCPYEISSTKSHHFGFNCGYLRFRVFADSIKQMYYIIMKNSKNIKLHEDYNSEFIYSFSFFDTVKVIKLRLLFTLYLLLSN